MAEVERDGDLITIGDRVRIEKGPPLLTATATEALLSNEATASHYEVGKLDALGKPIVLGEEFAYLDWGGSKTEGKRIHYIFERVELSDEDRAREGQETTDEFRWVERGTRATEEAAITLGKSIAGD